MFRRESDESPVCSVRISAAAVAGILGTVIALLVLADVAGQISTYYFGHPAVLGLVALFDLDSEANMPSWYSASVLLICSGVLALIATAKTVRFYRWHGSVYRLASCQRTKRPVFTKSSVPSPVPATG